jgi:HEAT repeat protein
MAQRVGTRLNTFVVHIFLNFGVNMLSLRFILAFLTIFVGVGLFVCPAYSKTVAPTEPVEVPTLIKSLKTGNEEIRVNAADRLGRLCPKQDVGGAFAALIKAMNDPSDQVRVNAASALGELNVKQAVNVLILATHDRSSEVVMFTAQALGEIGSSASSAEPELLNLLENNSSEVRKVAAIALAKIGIGVEQAVLMMTEDLNLPDDASRYEAASALGYMGQAARPAIPTLKSLLKDQAFNIQQEACRTLRNIGTSDGQRRS